MESPLHRNPEHSVRWEGEVLTKGLEPAVDGLHTSPFRSGRTEIQSRQNFRKCLCFRLCRYDEAMRVVMCSRASRLSWHCACILCRSGV